MDGEGSKRKVLHKQTREIVYKVYQYFKNESGHADETVSKTSYNLALCQGRTASACGIGIRTVQRISSEARSSFKKSGTVAFQSPGKRHNRKKEITELDDFDKNVLRRTIFDMYASGDFPTGKKLVEKMKESIGFSGSRWSLQRILKAIGFNYKRSNDRGRFLMERTDIVAARVMFLRTMHDIKQAGTAQIYYLDETWVNQNHTKKTCWKVSDSSGNLRDPIDAGGRLIVCLAGSAVTGLIPESKFIFRSMCKTSTDNRSDIGSVIFKKWFEEQFLPYLAPQSIIVMDNASIHSVLMEKTPCKKSRKCDIITWLVSKNIPHTATQTRAELLQLVKICMPRYKCYELDFVAMKQGHKVVRLPPHHSHYNPIELLWAQVESYVSERNDTFSIDDVERLTHEAIDNIKLSAWENCVKLAEKLMEEDFHRETIRDDVLEPIIVNLKESDSEDSNFSDDDEDNSD